MARQNRFVIRNDHVRPAVLGIEPEGALLRLDPGEEVSVHETFATDPVTLKLSTTEDVEILLAIWPGDGEVTVQKEGIDVLELPRGSPAADLHAIPNRV